jgi:hypothetical protein
MKITAATITLCNEKARILADSTLGGCCTGLLIDINIPPISKFDRVSLVAF